MQEDAPSCRHSHREAKNSVLCPRFLRSGGKSSFCSFSALLRQGYAFLRYVPLPFLPSFSLLSVPFHFCPSPFCLRFSVFSSFSFSLFFFRGGEIRHFVCGRERMKKKRWRSPFFFFLTVLQKRGRKAYCFFFFLLLPERKRQTIPAYGCWRSLLFFFFVFKIRKGERGDA